MIDVVKDAKDLPDEWDKKAGSNFALQKENLIFLEEVSPCDQRYVIFKSKEKEIDSLLIQYKLKVNVFCYSKLRLEISITIIGIPCSVCEMGYSFMDESRNKVIEKEKSTQFIADENKTTSGDGCREEVREYIKNLKGAKLILNGEDNLDFLGFPKGHTLPTCLMEVKWGSFQEYMQSLSSHYRYRYKKALKKIENFSVDPIENKSNFTEKHYALYEQVYNRSEYKLEKLTIEFFRKGKAQVVEFKKEEEALAFVQYTIHENEMFFLFGGLNYALNKKCDLYQNMLLQLVKLAVENKCTSLNLGQTAEEMKCKLGAYMEKKYLYVHHSNRLIQYTVSKFIGLVSYKMKKLKYSPF